MTLLIGALCLVLFVIIVVQIGKVTELASVVRGQKTEQYEINKWHGGLGMLFMVVFLVATVLSFIYYQPYMLSYGPNEAASEHGSSIDYVFNLTLVFTGIVFFVTQFLLFWYSWKYRGRKGHKAVHWAHDDRLEMIWMIIPAVVMTFLVVGGLQTWNTVMADVEEGEEYIEIEATGYQFGWTIRYPGKDGKLGSRDYKMISGTNPLGQDWSDKKNLDDFQPGEIVLPKGKKVRVRITSRDVLHNFYLPQFRVKMDAVPGMPTRFVFTPIITTEEKRQQLKEHAAWQVPSELDEEKQRWETFDFELACAELCGKGHYSMQKIVRIVTPEEYEAWLDEQQSFYESTVKGTADDPYAKISEATEDSGAEEAPTTDNAGDSTDETEQTSTEEETTI